MHVYERIREDKSSNIANAQLSSEQTIRSPTQILLGGMGPGQSAPLQNRSNQSQNQNRPSLVDVGLAMQWPKLLMKHEDFERYVRR